MTSLKKISPCLSFDGQAEQAAEFYTGIFYNSRITGIARYGEAGRESHGHEPGSVLMVSFVLDGLSFTALNVGPDLQFTLAMSLQVDCADQEEIDYFWEHLGAGGDPEAHMCGWLKDKFGVAWQVLPHDLPAMLNSTNAAAAERTVQALQGMKKLNLDELRRAYAGSVV